MHMDLIWGVLFFFGFDLAWLGVSLFLLYALPLSRRSSYFFVFIVPQKGPMPPAIRGTLKKLGLLDEKQRDPQRR